MVGIVLDFIAPDGVTLNVFSWLSGLDEERTWPATGAFPRVETASFGAGRIVELSVSGSAGPCGIGRVPFLLFTSSQLCVMKLDSRRRTR